MVLERQERPFPISSRNAVEDAMIWAQMELLNTSRTPNSRTLQTLPAGADLDVFTAIQTAGKCKEGSLAAVEFLSQKYSDLFSGIVLLQADAGTEKLRNGWGNHYYFLARDINSKWFAASPANFEPSRGGGNLTRIIAHDDLSQVLKWIKRFDNGKWPTTEFIEEVFRNDPLVKPKNPSTPLLLKFWQPPASLGNHSLREVALPYIAASIR